MIFIIRLCPTIPFITFNLAVSLTHIPLQDFMIGNLGMLPGIILRVFIGTTLQSLTADNGLRTNKWIIGFIVVGTIIAILTIVYITIQTKKHLRELDLNPDNPEEMELSAPVTNTNQGVVVSH